MIRAEKIKAIIRSLCCGVALYDEKYQFDAHLQPSRLSITNKQAEKNAIFGRRKIGASGPDITILSICEWLS
jgi:hypothetical protein